MAIHRSPKQQLEERKAFCVGSAERLAERSKQAFADAAECMAEEQAFLAEARELEAAIEALS